MKSVLHRLWARMKETAKKIPWLVTAVYKLRAFIRQYLYWVPNVPKLTSKQIEENIDVSYFSRIQDKVEQIPLSNGSRFFVKLPYRVGWITDQILYDAFKDAADGVLLTPTDWEKQIDQIDWLFIISGWHGIKTEWNGFARPESESRHIMYKIIQICKNKKIPTVFYSVEDPPNYKRFIGIAQQCDYAFTAAIEMLPQYYQDCEHKHIYQMCYSINPMLHNPIGIKKFTKEPEIFFAGSWMEKYPERVKDMSMLLEGILSSGKSLKIIDRNLNLSQAEYRFPIQYAPYISPPIEHTLLQRVHKLYNWAININSVKNSFTMFANRAYELQAMGNLMISNYSVGINSLLPTIFTCQNQQEIPAILNSMSPEEIYEHQVMGIRLAMRGNTCFDRMAFILCTIGLKIDLPKPHVAVVISEDNESLYKDFSNQSYPYRSIVNEDKLIQNYAQYDIIAFFHPQAQYEDFYLEDMINGFKYTDSDYITKSAYYQGDQFIAGTEHDYVSHMPNKYRTVFWAKSFNPRQLLEMVGSIDLPNGYSIDHFMFNAERRIAIQSEPIYELSVIVPVYNNGPHLYGKAFSSLRRSSIFEKMEILLIDDGSTDDYTKCIVRTLARQYTNVKVFFFDDGGSGSASRPRNKGVEMAHASYITFLDPDNEAVNDAYAKMLEIAKQNGEDIVVGNMSRFRLSEELANYHYYFEKYYGSDTVTGNKQDFLSKIRFTPMSIQAMVIRKSIIIDSKISQVVGAVGQDSFFSWQLFISAKKIKSVPLVAHIYYAMVQNSTVNHITPKYFQRSLLQERVQREWLEQNHLLDNYMKYRFNGFFRDWYMVKLDQADPETKTKCSKILMEIFALYSDVYCNDDPVINRYVGR